MMKYGWLVCCVACGAARPQSQAPTHRADVVVSRPVRYQPVRTTLPLPDVSGLSDLTQDASGTLWAVTERKKMLVGISGTTITRVPITLDKPLDIESLAWLGGDEFVFGTESQLVPREGDTLLFARKSQTGVEVTKEVAINAEIWGLNASKNHGLEGLCAADDALIAALEEVKVEGARRLAPLARIDLKTMEITPFWLELTSPTGKISALSCRPDPVDNDIDILAVERHFGVARVISARVRRVGPSETLSSQVVLDLLPFMQDKDNFEGIVAASSSQITLITDNDFGGVTGPTVLLRLTADPQAASTP